MWKHFDWRPGEYFLTPPPLKGRKEFSPGKKIQEKGEKKRKERKKEKRKKIRRKYSLRERKFWTMMTERGETIKLLVRIYSPVGDART